MTGLRPERAVDAGAIAAVLNAAFANGGEPVAEAVLVDQLRRDGDLDLSLVAVNDDGGIVGHVALSPLAATFPALALAPAAWRPYVQLARLDLLGMLAGRRQHRRRGGQGGKRQKKGQPPHQRTCVVAATIER